VDVGPLRRCQQLDDTASTGRRIGCGKDLEGSDQYQVEVYEYYPDIWLEGLKTDPQTVHEAHRKLRVH
jgi:hypothetical protein